MLSGVSLTYAQLQLVWKLCTENSIWSNWMKFNYRKDSSFCSSTTHPMDSGTWKFLVNKKNEAVLYMRKKIADGHSISLWFDPWLKEGSIADVVASEITSEDKNWLVDRIIQDGQWALNTPPLTQIWPVITAVQIHSDIADTWCCNLTSSGKFTFTTAWNVTRCDFPEVDYYNVVWYSSVPNILIVYLELSITGCLLQPDSVSSMH